MSRPARAILLTAAAVALTTALAVWTALPRSIDEAHRAPGGPAGSETKEAPAPALAGRAGEPSAKASGDPSGRLMEPATLAVRVVGWLRRPVAGAEVELTEGGDVTRSLATDAEGKAVFQGIRSPTTNVRVVHPGYEGDNRPHALEAGEHAEVVVPLATTRRLQGSLVDAADSRPIAGARVLMRFGGLGALLSEDGEVELALGGSVAETDSNGRFVLPDLWGSDFALFVEAEGYERGEREVRLHRSPDGPGLPIRLARAGSVRATVRDWDGRPVEGAVVALLPEDFRPREAAEGDDGEAPTVHDLCCGSRFMGPQPIYAARTGEDGVAVIDGLRLGRAFRAVPVRHDDGRWPGGDVSTATQARPVVQLDVRLEPLARLELRCVDPDGNAVQPGVFPARGDTAWEGQDGKGRFLHRAGACEGTVRELGFLPFDLSLTLLPGEVRRVDVRLARGAAVSGRLLDQEGRPFAEGQVGVVGEEYVKADVGEDGRFVLAGLPAGMVRLVFGAPDTDFEGELVTGAPSEGVEFRLQRSVRFVVSARAEWLSPERNAPEDSYWSLQSADGGENARDLPDDHGRKRWSVDPGRHVLRVFWGSCLVLERRFEVVDEPVDLGTLERPVGPPCEGLVTFADGTPVPSAALDFGPIFRPAYADAGGRVRFDHGPPVPLAGEVHGLWCPPQRFTIPACRDGAPWRVVVRAGGVIQGAVEGAESGSRLRLRIEPLSGEEASPVSTVVADSFGRFEALVLPGRYRVALLENGRETASAVATVVADEPCEVALKAPPTR